MARIEYTGTTATAMVVGEALVDIVKDSTGTQTVHPGGSPLNVAVGLGRLGVKTVLATRVSDDRFGTDIRTHLRNAGGPCLGRSSCRPHVVSHGDAQGRWLRVL